ncbi:MAG: (2Fe-2S)-binding protein [Alphaproteobacteria bacterium]|nr:(2Fe-2S)-binding protein [Alphaproteobacteria bacterium]
MYVCMCNGYRDSEIRDLARRGVRCARAAYAALGGGPECGECLDFTQALIDGELGGRQSERSPVSPMAQKTG